MVSVLFDSNIVIDQTLGILEASLELAAYDDAALSVITWMEATVKLDAAAIGKFDQRLGAAGIRIVHTNHVIMRLASQLQSRRFWRPLDVSCTVRMVNSKIVNVKAPLQ